MIMNVVFQKQLYINGKLSAFQAEDMSSILISCTKSSSSKG